MCGCASGCVLCPLEYCIEYSRQYLYFKSKMSGSKSESSDVAGTASQQLLYSQVALVVMNLPANAGDMRDVWVIFLGQEDLLEEGMATHFSCHSCLENPHGQRSLAGYCPWDHKESDMTEAI